LVQDLHGLDYHVRRNVFDPAAGARLKAGTKHLGPWEALALARSRKAFSQGDIARTTNQGHLLMAFLRQFRDDVKRNPVSLLRWISIGRRNTRLNLGPRETFELGVLASQVKAPRVGQVTVPVSIGSVGAASVVFISPRAQSIYRRFEKHGAL
jgi:anionic cell wall polymer biosynthesis LytR-Cps2A-Psr (LCP) family protein